MIFKNFQIQNFQSHKNSLIEFDPEVTAIVGLGNHGKSAVLKALVKVVRNEPNGSSFIRNLPEKVKLTTLTLQTEDKNTDTSYTIERKVSRSSSNAADNMYKAESTAGDSFEFTKFARTGIPEEISNRIGVSLPQLFGDVEFDLNFHIQKENDFLIRGKGLSSIRSKVMSRITGVDVAQKAIQIERLKEKQYNQEVDRLREQKQKDTLELSKYVELDNYLALINVQFEKINELNSLQGDIDYFKISLDKLQNLIGEAIVLKKKIDKVSITFDLEVIREKQSKLILLKKYHTFLLSLERVEKIANVLQKSISVDNVQELFAIKKLLQSVILIGELIKKLNIIINTKLPNLEVLNCYKEEIELYNNYRIKLDNVQVIIKNKEAEIVKLDKEQLIVQQQLEDYKKEIKVCPTCQRNF